MSRPGRRYVAAVGIAAILISACSPAATPRSGNGRAAPLHSSAPSTALRQPSVHDVALQNEPATRCANRVRMGLVLTPAERPLPVQLHSFARSGASTAERRVFGAALPSYLAARATSGATAALALPSFSYQHLLLACRAALK